jgi:alkylation response protein AidB-like acyl-CoA dehydrogenase
MSTPFDLDDTQRMLQDSLSRFLADQHGLEQRLHQLDQAHDAPPLWRAFAEDLGILGAAFSEDQGGLGGGLAEHLLIMEAFGEALYVGPYVSTAVIAGSLLQRSPEPAWQTLLGRILEGRSLVAFAHTEPAARHGWQGLRTSVSAHPSGDGLLLSGHKTVVHSARWATDLLVTALDPQAGQGDQGNQGVSLLCVPAQAPGIRRSDVRTIDGGHASELFFDKVPVQATQCVGPRGQARPLVEQALDEATLATCAEALGVLQRLMRDTLDYVRQRRQFGAPIASFQALQHRLADMHLALEQARALTAATLPLLQDASAAQRATAVSSAKVSVNRACRLVGQGAVQLHGGMGMTEELAIGHYFRRATMIEQQFGPSDWHIDRIAQAHQTPR